MSYEEYESKESDATTLENASWQELVSSLHLYLEGGMKDELMNQDLGPHKDFWDFYGALLTLVKKAEYVLRDYEDQHNFEALGDLKDEIIGDLKDLRRK